MNVGILLGLVLVITGTLAIIFFDAGVLIALGSLIVIGGAWLVHLGFRGSQSAR
ncbi:MAG TPA: hypothetical protein H9871_12040 [Candidatus Nesterenkonia stercoripullorum]|uniref:Uncharacterized protein n=1 Tax=Candidatus Nesterenkonia stercoripullorum TaxID=2838701 RepID=A0A9D1UUY9_9MICC|nr:hypothetical protein [Candidatus Nesterenkonia stercoripullorum]